MSVTMYRGPHRYCARVSNPSTNNRTKRQKNSYDIYANTHTNTIGDDDAA